MTLCSNLVYVKQEVELMTYIADVIQMGLYSSGYFRPADCIPSTSIELHLHP